MKEYEGNMIFFFHEYDTPFNKILIERNMKKYGEMYKGNIEEFPNVTSSGEMYSRIQDLPLGSTAGHFSKSPVHFPKCDIIKGGSEGCTRKKGAFPARH